MAARARQIGVQPVTTSQYDPEWRRRQGESTLFFRDEDLVGIEKAQQELLGWLMDEEPRCTVITVLGMGGSGKTTLIANTFRKQSVQNHFDICIWITVSREYDPEQMLRSMLKDVLKHESVDSRDTDLQVDWMDFGDLAETIVQKLQQRRYLIVFDDVWRPRFWQWNGHIFAQGMHRSRVMMSTRKQYVALSHPGKLFNLLVLLLNHAKFKKLPNEIAKLRNLRHLKASYLIESNDSKHVWSVESISVPSDICMIHSLLVLNYVNIRGNLLSKLKRMSQLIRLGFDGTTICPYFNKGSTDLFGGRTFVVLVPIQH